MTLLRAFRTVLMLSFVTAALGALSSYSRQLRNPLPLDYGEAIVLWQAQHIWDRDMTYRPIDTPPYNVTHYPPLYHLAVRAGFAVTGDWLYSGRLVSLLSGSGLVLLFGLTTFLLLPARSPLWDRIAAATVSACSIFLCTPSEWMSYARVDFLGLCLMFGGLSMLCLGRGRWAWECAGILLLVAAGFAKQAFFTVPAAAFLAQALLDLRRFLIWVAWGGALAAIPFLYWQNMTNGGFLLNLVSYNRNPYLLSTLSAQLHRVLEEHSILMVLGVPVLLYGLVQVTGAGAALYSVWRKKAATRPFRWYLSVLTIHLVISGLWLLGMGKVGSGPNYALPFLFTLNLGAGLTVWALLSHWRRSRGVAVYSGLCVAALAAVLLVPQARALLRRGPSPAQAAALRDWEQLLAVLREEPGPIYSEDMMALLQTGHAIPAEPAIVTTLAETGGWDESPFVNSILARHWSLILVNDLSVPERFSPAVRAAIQGAYRETTQIGNAKLYRPLPTAP